MSALEKFNRLLSDALWSDGRYHVEPRAVVEHAERMRDELLATIGQLNHDNERNKNE